MKYLKKIPVLSILLLLILTTSCKSDDTNSDEGIINENTPYLKAMVNGEPFVGSIRDFNTDDESFFTAEAYEGEDAIIRISCNFPPAVGTYDYDSYSEYLYFTYVNLNNSANYNVHYLADETGTGTVSITEFQADGITTTLRGTFSFTAICADNCNGVDHQVNVTEGEFYLKLNR